MKRQLTFPLIRMIFKSTSLLFILLLAGISYAIAFFPDSPAHLTLIDNNKQHYQAVCPELSPTTITIGAKALPSSFTLLNWNIYKQKRNNWEVKLQEWATTADLITLQEAKYSPELISFSDKNGFFYLQNFAFKQSGFIYGVNTLSKASPIAACGTRQKEPWIIVRKTALASTYPIQGSEETLLVINLHGINFTFTERPLIKQLAPYLSLINRHQGPVIFSGDFNTWSDARLEGVDQTLLEIGFSELAFEYDQRSRIFGLPLDHIYFRDLKVVDAQSLITKASDHNPLLVTFEIEQ